MIMPFGDYKDEEISDIPSDYLSWMSLNMERDDLREAAEEELSKRDDNRGHF